MQQVRDMLTRDNQAVFSPDVDAEIRTAFDGLVAGDSALPWVNSCESATFYGETTR